jgi:hypothetical protein
MGIKMTQPPDKDVMKMVQQLEEQGLKHLVEPLTFLLCVSTLLADCGTGAWNEERAIGTLCKALNEPLEDHFKDHIRPWAKRQRPDLEKLREYSRSWRDTYSEQRYGIHARISEGLSRAGVPSKRFFFGGRRVTEVVFHTLVCEQQECPKHQATMRLFKGLPEVRQEQPLFVTHLAEERWTDHDGQKVLARRASVHKQVACPHAVHTPKTINTPAWDLFDLSGHFVATVSVINTAQHN